MIKEINIDGEVYVKKKKSKMFFDFQKESIVLEPCNVLGILPIEKNKEIDDNLEIFLGKYKLVEEKDIIPQIKGFSDKFEVYKVHNSKYSKEFIDMAIKTAKCLGYEDIEVFMQNNNDFVDDQPLVILFDKTMAFLLAPRVEKGDEE